MAYKHFPHTVDLSCGKVCSDIMQLLDWLWRNAGYSKRGDYERNYYLEWSHKYSLKDPFKHSPVRIPDTVEKYRFEYRKYTIQADTWTTRRIKKKSGTVLRFYFKDAGSAIAFKILFY